MDAPDAVVNNMAAVMDVPGFNYRPFKYIENYKKLPQEIILGSETASTISSRGVYKFPVVRRSMPKYPDHQSSSYDVEHCGWSNLPEDDFIQHEDLPYCIGEFVWTGFDYLGEPTPYYSDWPSHSSLFGIIDLAGIPSTATTSIAAIGIKMWKPSISYPLELGRPRRRSNSRIRLYQLPHRRAHFIMAKVGKTHQRPVSNRP